MSRQSSSSEPLKGLPTVTAAPGSSTGRLPLFPSWSLLHLGSSYLYSHSSGVGQPGFLPGSKFLLPWDVPVRQPTWDHIKAHWPNLADIAMKRPNFQPRGRSE